jgi:hypothetical protein
MVQQQQHQKKHEFEPSSADSLTARVCVQMVSSGFAPCSQDASYVHVVVHACGGFEVRLQPNCCSS